MQQAPQGESKPIGPGPPNQGSANNQAASSHQFPKFILVLGPPDCAKPLVKEIMDQYQQQPPPMLPRAGFKCSTCKIDEQIINFINTPDFGDPASVRTMFVGLIDYLLTDPYTNPSRSLPIRLTGIIYVHSAAEGNEEGIQSLRKNLRMLKAFVGDHQLETITFLVKPQNETQQEADIHNMLKSQQSPFHIFFRQPKIAVSELGIAREPIKPHDLLLPYLFAHGLPRRLFVQTRVRHDRWTKEGVAKFLQEAIDADATDHSELPKQTAAMESSPQQMVQEANPPGDKHEHNTTAENLPQEGQEMQTDLPGTNPSSDEHVPADRAEGSESGYKKKFEDLQIKHKETEAEYASFRAHLQIQDNIEEGHITLTFDDINRSIEVLGHSISEEMFMNHSESVVPINRFEASRLQQLAKLLTHTEETASLAAFIRCCPDPEDFVDYAIRATLSGQLYKNLFEPFHPNLAGRDNERENNFLVTMYGQVASLEPQSVAGRWRRDSFNSISGLSKQNHVHSIRKGVLDALQTLLKTLSRSPVDRLLTKEHEKLLDKLATQAEDWNRLVRGSVVFHGDFQPIAFHHGHPFQPKKMSKFGAKPKDTSHPEFCSVTVQLGLIKSFAVGGGQKPEETALRNALII